MAMRKLAETVLFDKTVNKQQLQDTAGKIIKNIGIIQPSNIDTQLFSLKKSTLIKRSPLLQTAINEYETGRSIKLFNTNLNQSSNTAALSCVVPYIVGRDGSVYMNMNRICNWTADMETITDLNELSDLRAVLEIAYITTKLTDSRIFENNAFIEHLTSIYVIMTMNTMSKCLGVSQSAAVDTTIVNMKYCVAKFFLIYCLGRQDGDAISAIAYAVSKNNSSTYNNTVIYEENTGIEYNDLEHFLTTFAMNFFANNLNLTDFVTNWMKLYGEATRIAIEYPPYLLYFVYATFYNARLGSNNTRLVTRYKEQLAFDLNKVVSAIYNNIR